MAANKKYNPQYHDAWAWSLAAKGATDEEIADAMGISRRTIYRWSWTEDKKGNKTLTSFGEALSTGKDAADAQVERTLYQRCKGFEVEEEEQTINVDNKGGSTIGKIVKKKRYIPPDTMAIMYWLNNRKREEWNNKYKSESSNIVDDWVDSIPDVTEGNNESK